METHFHLSPEDRARLNEAHMNSALAIQSIAHHEKWCEEERERERNHRVEEAKLSLEYRNDIKKRITDIVSDQKWLLRWTVVTLATVMIKIIFDFVPHGSIHGG